MIGLADHVRLFKRLVSHGQASANLDLPQDETSYKSFAAFVTRHHVAHYVLARIEEDCAPGSVPNALATMLRAEVERRRERNEGLMALMPELDRALRGAGLEYLMLKGMVFAARYYTRLDQRRQNDIDILVLHDDLSSALAALQELGFCPRPRRLKKSGENVSVRPRLQRTEHALVLSRGELGVDLHWSLRTAPAYRFDETAIWAARQPVRIEGVQYVTLSDEHALLMLLVSLGHDLGRGAGRLKHFLDVHQILMTAGKTLDWEAFFHQRAEDNTLSIVVNVLDLYLRLIAERTEHPNLIAALREHDASLVCRDDNDALALLDRPKGDPRNHRWFLKVYPVSWKRDAIWWFARNVPHPRRISVATSKAVRYLGRCAWQLLTPESRSHS